MISKKTQKKGGGYKKYYYLGKFFFKYGITIMRIKQKIKKKINLIQKI